MCVCLCDYYAASLALPLPPIAGIRPLPSPSHTELATCFAPNCEIRIKRKQSASERASKRAHEQRRRGEQKLALTRLSALLSRSYALSGSVALLNALVRFECLRLPLSVLLPGERFAFVA